MFARSGYSKATLISVVRPGLVKMGWTSTLYGRIVASLSSADSFATRLDHLQRENFILFGSFYLSRMC